MQKKVIGSFPAHTTLRSLFRWLELKQADTEALGLHNETETDGSRADASHPRHQIHLAIVRPSKQLPKP